MYKYFKRFFDFVLALFGLLMLSPIFLLLVIVVKIDSKGPIFFNQKRMGRNKKHFRILKFRTMKVDTPHDTATHLLKDHDSYVTRSGNILRKYSLDELPQLINILKGDMSAIGPRPALWNQFDLIKERDKYGANDVRPGLTGLAQIYRESEPPIHVKAKMDGEYIEKMSFIFDLEVALKTMVSIVKR